MPMPAKTLISPPVWSSEARASRQLVWVRCLTRLKRPDEGQWPAWLAACHRLTPHLQRFGSDDALLDLGRCADHEAVAVTRALIARLHEQRVTLRATIGPSGMLAQLALLRLVHQVDLPRATSSRVASRDEPFHNGPLESAPLLALVTAEQRADLLRQLPIDALTRIQFADGTAISPKVVATLGGYGVRTLAHLARLDEADLRRQFGAHLGALLAAVARGADRLPLQPTPTPLRLHFRLRLTAPVAADRLLSGLAPFTGEVAARLERRGLQAQTLEIRLRWETGASPHSARSRTNSVTRTLPQPLASGRALNATVRRMLITLMRHDALVHTQAQTQAQAQTRAHAGAQVHADIDVDTDTDEQPLGAHEAIEDFHLIVSRLAPRYPAQRSFWPEQARQRAVVHELADVLTHRYGRPLVMRGVLTAPDAIFEQDRSQLAPIAPDATARAADVLEGPGQRAARPAADVAVAVDAGDDVDTLDISAEIRHGAH